MADSTVYLGWQYPIEQYVHVIVFCVVENSIVALTRAAGDGDTCYLHPKLLFTHSLAQGNRGNGNHSLSLFSLATMIVSWMKQSNELFDCNLVHSLFHLLFHINGSKCKCFIHQFHSDGSTEKKVAIPERKNHTTIQSKWLQFLCRWHEIHSKHKNQSINENTCLAIWSSW